MGAKALAFSLALILAAPVFPAGAGAFCFREAGEKYGLPEELLMAIAKVESAMNPAAIHINKDGSYDFGLMQINSFWYSVVGSKEWDRLDEACANVLMGAFILSQCVERYGYIWESVGCYNAANKKKRADYVKKVMEALASIETKAKKQ